MINEETLKEFRESFKKWLNYRDLWWMSYLFCFFVEPDELEEIGITNEVISNIMKKESEAGKRFENSLISLIKVEK